ncbi:MAG: CRISPR-associated endonuclease Cas1 [Paracoccaceae bacterium]
MARIRTLVVDEYGAYVGKHSNRITVRKKGEVLEEAPVMFLDHVLILGRGVSISADAVALCAGQGIPVHYLSHTGKPYGALYAAGLGGTVQTRRAQYLAYDDHRGVALAAAFAEGKIRNQSRLLKYLAKSRKTRAPAVYDFLRSASRAVRRHVEELKAWRRQAWDTGVERERAGLLAIEGRAAQAYWDGVARVLPAELAWPGRRGRGARDPFNAALNYGYGVLYGQVERACLLAGLDVYAGFIHADRPGKPSLVLDLIEPFRAPVVDRAVLGLVGQGVALDQDDEGWLARETRRAIADRVIQRLEESTERYERKRQKLRWILQSQARHMATYLRGERAEYRPFLCGW